MLTTLCCALFACALAHPVHESDECVCKQGRTANVWCGPCHVGYLASVPVRSKRLYEDIDPHGHDVDPSSLQCPTCIKGHADGGYCKPCHTGFVDGKAYYCELTYLLARGTPQDPDQIDCDACRENAKTSGWCGKCRAGFVGNTRFDDRDLHKRATTQFHRLLAAIQHASRCESCASAMMVDAQCPKCRIDYRDGKPLPTTQPKSVKP